MALYWRTTIKVAAGAVAAAVAPKVSTAEMVMAWGIKKCTTSNARSTTMVVTTAWAMPTMKAWRPVSFSCSRRNSLPMEKAMNPRARSLMTPSRSSCS